MLAAFSLEQNENLFWAHKFVKIWHSHSVKFSTVVWQNSAVCIIPYRTTYFTRGQFRQHMLAAFSLEQNENFFFAHKFVKIWHSHLVKFSTVVWQNSAVLK
jgi:hypothetical protein